MKGRKREKMKGKSRQKERQTGKKEERQRQDGGGTGEEDRLHWKVTHIYRTVKYSKASSWVPRE